MLKSLAKLFAIKTQDGNAAMRGLNTKLGYATTRTGAQVARDLPL